ncbi:MAG TPA: hypothetical protein VKH40_01235 [Alloacidobacterium sp.]|nr:hypothetical protein [Alloacidobacterium sp.]
MYNECRHIFTSGKKCQSPALRDQSFCYFHGNTRKRPAPKDEAYEPYIPPQDAAHNLPPLEDADAIQLALSDVVLPLAANRIDARRARILIYGLQVASQNHHRRVLHLRGAEGAANAGLQDAATMVRETHEDEDGTLIGPAQQSPDLEEIEEQRRPPSLGEILLREAEALQAQAQAERQAAAQQKAAEVVPGIVDIQSVADTLPSTSCHRSTRRKKSCDCTNDPLQREAAQLQRGVIEHGMLKSVRKATITEIWERLDFHSDRRQAAQDLT